MDYSSFSVGDRRAVLLLFGVALATLPVFDAALDLEGALDFAGALEAS